MTEMTREQEYTATLVWQLRQFKRMGRLKYVRLLTDEDRMMVRVHQKVGGWVINTDVFYDRGADLYNVKVYRLDMRLYAGKRPTDPYGVCDAMNPNYGEVVDEREYVGMGWEDLPEVVGRWR